LALTVALAGCGSDSNGSANTASGTDPAGGGDAATIMVTTSILGDITDEIAGDDAVVETIVPIGADPHEFSPSARQAEEMAQADLLVVNGAGFEEGLQGLIDQAEDSGVPVFAFADHVDRLAWNEDDHDHGHDEDTESGEEDRGHDHGEWDPHLWTDPRRIADAVEALYPVMADLDGVDAADLQARATAYLDELVALDEEIEELLADVPEERRVLVTNHDVFAYFADRYDFEVVGTVIPSVTTLAEPTAAELEALAQEIQEHDVPAIFAETTQSTQLAEALAGSVGDVAVVELYTESLGEEGSGAETYVGLMRTNAELIAGALR
jgi:zinc/manganese transport system substrate-binding protein